MMEAILLESYTVVKMICTRALPVLFVFFYLQERGLLAFLDRFSRRIVRGTGFSTITGQAFIANTGSAYAGSGLLISRYNAGEITRGNLLLSVIFAGFPAHVRVVATLSAPMVFSLFTFPVALFYVLFSFCVAIVKLMIAALLSHRLIRSPAATDGGVQPAAPDPAKKDIPNRPTAFRRALRQTGRYAARIIVLVTLITAAVFFLNQHDVFHHIPLSVRMIGLPADYDVALFSYIGNAYAGMGLIGTYLIENTLNTRDGILLLLFCMICARPIAAIKEAPSYYVGLFGITNGGILISFHLLVFTLMGLAAIWGIRLLFP